MSEFGPETPPSVLGAIRQFHNEFEKGPVLVYAIDRYLMNELELSEESSIKMRNTLLADISSMDELHEYAPLIPVMEISDIKKMQLDHAEYALWFEGAVSMALVRAHEEHDVRGCVPYQDYEFDKVECACSAHCPYRSVRSKVLKDLRNTPDSTRVRGVEYPWSDEEAIGAQLRTAHNRALLPDASLVSYMQSYRTSHM